MQTIVEMHDVVDKIRGFRPIENCPSEFLDRSIAFMNNARAGEWEIWSKFRQHFPEARLGHGRSGGESACFRRQRVVVDGNEIQAIFLLQGLGVQQQCFHLFEDVSYKCPIQPFVGFFFQSHTLGPLHQPVLFDLKLASEIVGFAPSMGCQLDYLETSNASPEQCQTQRDQPSSTSSILEPPRAHSFDEGKYFYSIS